MAKLCQVIAVKTGKASQTQRQITEINKKLQKPVLFQGFSKRYTPKDDDGEVFPDEQQKVQFKVGDVLAEVRQNMAELIDITATQDVTNCEAKANIVVDGVAILENVPVTHLLWLEKTLTDLHTIIESTPVLDHQENWTYDPNAGYHVTEPVTTTKTKKEPKVVVKYPATEQHPAQTELLSEDKIIGTWKQIKFSAALPADTKKELLVKVGKLQVAVKIAREEANSRPAVDTKYGDKIFDFVLGKK